MRVRSRSLPNDFLHDGGEISSSGGTCNWPLTGWACLIWCSTPFSAGTRDRAGDRAKKQKRRLASDEYDSDAESSIDESDSDSEESASPDADPVVERPAESSTLESAPEAAPAAAAAAHAHAESTAAAEPATAVTEAAPSVAKARPRAAALEPLPGVLGGIYAGLDGQALVPLSYGPEDPSEDAYHLSRGQAPWRKKKGSEKRLSRLPIRATVRPRPHFVAAALAQ